MILITLMILIIVWLLSCFICGLTGFYAAKENVFGKRRKRTASQAEPSESEIYRRDKKQREEENFWAYDGTEQDSG